ncbi:nitroreductase family protein [Ensifer adhaerens]|uniref:Nitroreductase family protein n=1 Tax=Ensifer adhaerens TaxID=106592 RepID=A0A9Q8YHU4_ENSAD|nr:nitroreductase family protein [Ensifer adhaerens]USJ28416.1 nitroreductase family protein [Ensifer adhaerens]
MNADKRKADYPIPGMFVERWSARALTGEGIAREELLTLLEAARWAPSAFNAQPWRFVYTMRGDEGWESLFSTLLPLNQSWVQRAAAIVFLVSKTTRIDMISGQEVANTTHAFDTGAAWGYLALHAHLKGWVAHAMIGLDFARATAVIGLPDDHIVLAAVAIGRQGSTDTLPENLKPRELPSPREKLETLTYHVRFDQTRQ